MDADLSPKVEAMEVTDAKSPPASKPKALPEEKPVSPSRLAALKEEGAKVLSDARNKVEEVARKVQTAEPVNSMVMKASQMRDTANTAAQKTKGRAKEGIDQLRTAAGTSYSSLKENGMRAWLSEHLAQARDLATRQITWTVDTGKGMADALRQACHAKVASALQGLRESYVKGKTQAATAVENAKAKASAAQVKAKEVVQDKHVQATAAGVLGGAATLGASGGATGLAAGAAAGAAIGVVPAIFTFGLSIPVGAAIGGGAGLAVGASVGALSGAAAGGAAGYQAYAKREQIGELKTNTVNKVNNGIDNVKGKAVASAQFLKDKASEARQRLGRKA